MCVFCPSIQELAVIYIWRVVEVAYFQEPPETDPPVQEAPLALLIPTGLLIGANIVFGLWTTLSVGAAGEAAGVPELR